MLEDGTDRLTRLREDALKSLGSTFVGSFRIPRTPESPAVGPRQAGRAPSLREERRVRALAKEIKRLIAEDGRRGIGV